MSIDIDGNRRKKEMLSCATTTVLSLAVCPDKI
jgi:hypothetical protein